MSVPGGTLALLALLAALSAPVVYFSTGKPGGVGRGERPNLAAACARMLADRIPPPGRIRVVETAFARRSASLTEAMRFQRALQSAQTGRYVGADGLPATRERLAAAPALYRIEAHLVYETEFPGAERQTSAALCVTITDENEPAETFIPLRSEVLLARFGWPAPGN